MMRYFRITLTLIILLFSSFLINPNISFASTIYSNNFSSSVSGFTQFFGFCSPSSIGLSCTIGTGILYSSQLVNLTCVSANITNPNSIYSYIAFVDDTSTWLNNPVYLQPNQNGNLIIRTSSKLAVGPSSIPGTHNYMLCKNGNIYIGYVDQQPKIQLTEDGHNPISFALSYDETNITNLLVTDALPSASPSSDITLNVPKLMQTDSQWNTQEYDSAHVWAPSDPSIGSWGCALTSATMVLNYYGLTKLPDNQSLNPGTLNTWLKTQQDGYIGPGLINWIAIQRLSKKAKQSGDNPTFNYDALEYRHLNGEDKDTLLADLQHSQPDILEEPGHFVVAKGTQNTTFTINDPFFTNRATLNDSYNNSFLAINRYVPSHTDLSYMLFVTSPSTSLQVKTATGSAVGDSSIQTALQNDNKPSQMSGPSTQLLYMPQPDSGQYTLTVSNTSTPYHIDIYFYNKDGDVVKDTIVGINESNQATFLLNFSKDNLSLESITRNITIDSTLHDLKLLFQKGYIKNGMYAAIQSLLLNAQKEEVKNNSLVRKIQLITIQTILNVPNPLISSEAKDVLLYDITALLR